MATNRNSSERNRNSNLKGVAMKAPVTYDASFVANPDALFETLWNDLDWERRADAPRREYYCNDVDVPYAYGTGSYVREYLPRPMHPALLPIKAAVEARIGSPMEVCFLNGYFDARDALGWHADDSDSMNDDLPIAIVTVGARREIMFRPNSNTLEIERLWLDNGSLCLMAAGMQDAWQHKIPKAGFACGPRVSMTFRGLVLAGKGMTKLSAAAVA
jgi:alkylated DNA repair dioxygenase AlkB